MPTHHVLTPYSRVPWEVGVLTESLCSEGKRATAVLLAPAAANITSTA